MWQIETMTSIVSQPGCTCDVDILCMSTYVYYLRGLSPLHLQDVKRHLECEVNISVIILSPL